MTIEEKITMAEGLVEATKSTIEALRANGSHEMADFMQSIELDVYEDYARILRGVGELERFHPTICETGRNELTAICVLDDDGEFIDRDCVLRLIENEEESTVNPPEEKSE